MMSIPAQKAHELINLLDHSSSRVASAAVSQLWINRCTEELIDALLESRLNTVKGRIRATNTLQRFGKSVPRAIEVYVALLSDRSFDVAENALFGVVFWHDKSLLPIIDETLRSCASDRFRKSLQLAKKAIEKDNPFLFAKHFHDVGNVWQLDPVRFRRHIGPL